MLRGENASAKTLQSVVKSLESDKLKLEEKVKNLEQKLKENNEPLTVTSPSGKRESFSCVCAFNSNLAGFCSC